eukprot:1181911-Prorocentrum_minimum.AAC.3
MYLFNGQCEKWLENLESQKECVKQCYEELSKEVGAPRQLPDKYPVEVKSCDDLYTKGRSGKGLRPRVTISLGAEVRPDPCRKY